MAARDFRRLYEATLSVIRRQLLLTCSTEAFSYMGSILNFGLLSIPVFAGAYANLNASQLAAKISESSFATLYLIYGFTSLIQLFTMLSNLVGYYARVHDLLKDLEHLRAFQRALRQQREVIAPSNERTSKTSKDDDDDEEEEGAGVVRFEDVSFSAPTSPRELLVEDLTLEVRPGHNLLIMGPSGSGKSSLLRVLRGLWPTERGSIVLPSAGGKAVRQRTVPPYSYSYYPLHSSSSSSYASSSYSSYSSSSSASYSYYDSMEVVPPTGQAAKQTPALSSSTSSLSSTSSWIPVPPGSSTFSFSSSAPEQQQQQRKDDDDDDDGKEEEEDMERVEADDDGQWVGGNAEGGYAATRVFFIPQSPYVFKGTLVENLAYPFSPLFDYDDDNGDEKEEELQPHEDDDDEKEEEEEEQVPLHPRHYYHHRYRHGYDDDDDDDGDDGDDKEEEEEEESRRRSRSSRRRRRRESSISSSSSGSKRQSPWWWRLRRERAAPATRGGPGGHSAGGDGSPPPPLTAAAAAACPLFFFSSSSSSASCFFSRSPASSFRFLLGQEREEDEDEEDDEKEEKEDEEEEEEDEERGRRRTMRPSSLSPLPAARHTLGPRRRSCVAALRRQLFGAAAPRRGAGGDGDGDVLDLRGGVRVARVREALAMADLDILLERYGEEGLFTRQLDWSGILSPGEQQRLNFARLFLYLLCTRAHHHQEEEEEEKGQRERGRGRQRKGKAAVYAVLDEATSSMDEPLERRMYEQCRAAGITLISVGHRSSLHQYHQSLLLLFGRSSPLPERKEEEEEQEEERKKNPLPPHHHHTGRPAASWAIYPLPLSS